ncbi:MAG: hypothetical protein R3F49_07845 [Planctomycetota bacterium]
MKTVLLVVAAVPLLSPIHAQTCAGPLDLGTLPGGVACVPHAVSADGSVVVGGALDASGARRPFRWTAASGMQSLGVINGVDDTAYGVSANGDVVVGRFGSTAFRWTTAGGMEDIGGSVAYGVSADGSVVVGASGGRAFRWTAVGGMQDLGIGTLSVGSEAFAVSADGSVVVGRSTDAVGAWRPFRWTAASGLQVLSTGGSAFWEDGAYAVSANGDIVVGQDGGNAFRWTAATGMQPLFPFGSTARAVSADGLVVVGEMETAGPDHCFRWTEAGGLQDLGVFGTFGWSCDVNGVSADGTVIVGEGDYGFRFRSSVLGETYCRPTNANSTGCGAIVLANGDPRLATGSLQLTAALLPTNVAGYFLASRMQGLSPNAGGSQGNLCLGGNVGRFVGPGQVMSSGMAGAFTLVVDLSAMPTPTGLVPVAPGETWNFQAWHRDTNPGPTTNFTDAVSVTFR